MWAPDAAPKLLAEVFHGHELAPQRGSDLGGRMAAAFADAFAADAFAADAAGRVVLVGSDAPLMDGPAIDVAWDMLERRDIAIAPSYDGGYGLVGARGGLGADMNALFHGMRWSEADVFAQTMTRVGSLLARRPGLTCGILPMCYDIDAPADVLRIEGHLRALDLAGQPLPRHTHEALGRLR